MDTIDSTKLWDNAVIFKHGGGDVEWSFEIEEKDKENGHFITGGQPWRGMTVTKTGNNTEINIKAGRNGSESVAKWFRRLAVKAYVCDSHDEWPGKLNFAVSAILHGKVGNVIFETNIVIAQGHNARSRNNWWLGFCAVDKIVLTDNIELIFDVKTSGENVFIFSLKRI